MPELAKETVALLAFLMPGFLVGWVIYGLTSHQKPAQLERIIQALIFTLFVKVIVSAMRALLESFGARGFAFGEWSSESELAWSLITALLLGMGLAVAANRDWVHACFRRWGVSSRDAYPSEWFTVFTERPDQYIVLNLDDGRRLYGYPKIWPSDPVSGHFFLIRPVWLHSDPPVELERVEGVLIESKRVIEVEFVERPSDGQ